MPWSPSIGSGGSHGIYFFLGIWWGRSCQEAIQSTRANFTDTLLSWTFVWGSSIDSGRISRNILLLRRTCSSSWLLLTFYLRSIRLLMFLISCWIWIFLVLDTCIFHVSEIVNYVRRKQTTLLRASILLLSIRAWFVVLETFLKFTATTMILYNITWCDLPDLLRPCAMTYCCVRMSRCFLLVGLNFRCLV